MVTAACSSDFATASCCDDCPRIRKGGGQSSQRYTKRLTGYPIRVPAAPHEDRCPSPGLPPYSKPFALMALASSLSAASWRPTNASFSKCVTAGPTLGSDSTEALATSSASVSSCFAL